MFTALSLLTFAVLLSPKDYIDTITPALLVLHCSNEEHTLCLQELA